MPLRIPLALAARDGTGMSIQYGAYSGTCVAITMAGYTVLPRLTLDDYLTLPERDTCPECGKRGSVIDNVATCYQHASVWRLPVNVGLD